MSEYKIEIYSRNKNVFDDLMEYDPCLNTNRQFIIIKNLDKNKIKKIKRYCNKKKLRYNLINSSFERGSAYRRTFFNSNKSVHNHYFCAYCGRYIPKEKITVDHIIPIYSVKYSPFKQKILKMFGINNINCEKLTNWQSKSCANNGVTIKLKVLKFCYIYCIITLLRYYANIFEFTNNLGGDLKCSRK